ncbi:MAG TPA: hypothetical protein VHQ41_03475 [Patescibacteria group bacterium]|jgi:hypothetical protein|nr:hypothetical protein [Patescibacteria group bacterium]
MAKIIENIRSKPPHHRDRIIWICAAIAAALLLLIWVLVGDGHREGTDSNFFQTFNQGVNEGKNLVPQDINATENSNTQP